MGGPPSGGIDPLGSNPFLQVGAAIKATAADLVTSRPAAFAAICSQGLCGKADFGRRFISRYKVVDCFWHVPIPLAFFGERHFK
jgi:hypothetical protein